MITHTADKKGALVVRLLPLHMSTHQLVTL